MSYIDNIAFDAKKNAKKIRKLPLFFTILLLLFAAAIPVFHLAIAQRDVAGHVLRLHILANSDADADQLLKQKVRDRILKEYAPIFNACGGAEDAAEAAAALSFRIAHTAQQELRRNGALYPVSVKVEAADFPTKRYGAVRLPAGRYTALNVRIGSAMGHNWWCVLYPPLCLTNGTVEADEETLRTLKKELSAEEYALLTETDDIRVTMKFRILEILGRYIHS